jgi:hypothetical protein
MTYQVALMGRPVENYADGLYRKKKIFKIFFMKMCSECNYRISVRFVLDGI